MDGTLDLAKKEGRRIALVLNRVPSAGKLRDQVTAALTERGLPLLDPVLGNRTAFAQAFMSGLGAVEAAPKGVAAAEARALAAALRELEGK
jgi:chromosome partitioning protein